MAARSLVVPFATPHPSSVAPRRMRHSWAELARVRCQCARLYSRTEFVPPTQGMARREEEATPVVMQTTIDRVRHAAVRSDIARHQSCYSELAIGDVDEEVAGLALEVGAEALHRVHGYAVAA